MGEHSLGAVLKAGKVILSDEPFGLKDGNLVDLAVL